MRYRTFKQVYVIDAPDELAEFFDFYIKNRKPKQFFGSQYIRRDPLLKKEFGNAGENLYCNARKWIEGGFEQLINATAQKRPELRLHLTPDDVFKIDGPARLVQFLDFYLQNNNGNRAFTSGYLDGDEKFTKKFRALGGSLVACAKKHLKGGFDELVHLAAKQRPEILHYYEQGKQ